MNNKKIFSEVTKNTISPDGFMKYANGSTSMFNQFTHANLDEEVINFTKANIVKRLDEDDCNTLEDSGSIQAGYTYLGQMVAHDIVPSTTLHKNRLTSPTLNLDSIYDDTDYESKNHKNADVFDEKGRFIFGGALNLEDNKWIEGVDLNRDNKTRKALIPDQRNDENIIVSQLHLQWQKLHNLIIEEVVESNCSRNDAIQTARLFVTYIFNKVILDDYLREVLHPNIFDIYFIKDKQFFYDPNLDISKIPVEFSHAVFRFGHSMVRENYKLKRDVPEVNLKQLFLKEPKVLTSDKIIDWDTFFNFTPVLGDHPVKSITSSARKIDARITCAMNHLPFNNSNKDIRDLNLMANVDPNINMLTGKEVFEILSVSSAFKDLLIFENKSAYNNNQDKKIKNYDDLNAQNHQIPLWAYILKEAEFTKYEGAPGQNKLGIIGSVVVAEVLKISSNSATRPIKDKQELIKQINEFVKANDLTNSKGCMKMENILKVLQKRGNKNG